MPILIEAPSLQNQVIVTVEGRFDFSCHADFRRAFTSCPPNPSFLIDLSKATYMDSSALGMLLLLREKVAHDPSRITIQNAQGQPREVLDVANFAQLFRLT